METAREGRTEKEKEKKDKQCKPTSRTTAKREQATENGGEGSREGPACCHFPLVALPSISERKTEEPQDFPFASHGFAYLLMRLIKKGVSGTREATREKENCICLDHLGSGSQIPSSVIFNDEFICLFFVFFYLYIFRFLGLSIQLSITFF